MVLLKDVRGNSKTKSFGLQLYWIEREELILVMKSWWEEEEIDDYPGYVLREKFGSLKEKVKYGEKFLRGSGGIMRG